MTGAVSRTGGGGASAPHAKTARASEVSASPFDALIAALAAPPPPPPPPGAVRADRDRGSPNADARKDDARPEAIGSSALPAPATMAAGAANGPSASVRIDEHRIAEPAERGTAPVPIRSASAREVAPGAGIALRTGDPDIAASMRAVANGPALAAPAPEHVAAPPASAPAAAVTAIAASHAPRVFAAPAPSAAASPAARIGIASRSAAERSDPRNRSVRAVARGNDAIPHVALATRTAPSRSSTLDADAAPSLDAAPDPHAALAVAVAIGRADRMSLPSRETRDPPAIASWTPGASASAPATPVAVTATPAAFDASAWSEALAREVARAAAGAVHETELRLDPKGLGPISVRVRIDSDRVDVRFAIDHPVTLGMVRHALPDLERMLAGSGLSLGEASVFQESPQQGSTRQGAATETAAAVRLDGAGESAPTGSVPMRSRVGLFDDFV